MTHTELVQGSAAHTQEKAEQTLRDVNVVNLAMEDVDRSLEFAIVSLLSLVSAVKCCSAASALFIPEMSSTSSSLSVAMRSHTLEQHTACSLSIKPAWQL